MSSKLSNFATPTLLSLLCLRY